jgi:hypothetical protein
MLNSLKCHTETLPLGYFPEAPCSERHFAVHLNCWRKILIDSGNRTTVFCVATFFLSFQNHDFIFIHQKNVFNINCK